MVSDASHFVALVNLVYFCKHRFSTWCTSEATEHTHAISRIKCKTNYLFNSETQQGPFLS